METFINFWGFLATMSSKRIQMGRRGSPVYPADKKFRIDGLLEEKLLQESVAESNIVLKALTTLLSEPANEVWVYMNHHQEYEASNDQVLTLFADLFPPNQVNPSRITSIRKAFQRYHASIASLQANHITQRILEKN